MLCNNEDEGERIDYGIGKSALAAMITDAILREDLRHLGSLLLAFSDSFLITTNEESILIYYV